MKEVVNTGKNTSDNITTMLEERAIGAGTVTFDGLRKTLMEAIADSGISPAATAAPDPPLSATNTISQHTSQSVHEWDDGTSHFLPQNYSIPSCSPLQLWIKWCCPSEKHGPLRFISCSDFCTRNSKKRYSDAKFLLRKIESKATSLGTELPSLMDPETATKIFKDCEDAIKVPNTTKTNRTRRSNQLVWTTIVRAHRDANRACEV